MNVKGAVGIGTILVFIVLASFGILALADFWGDTANLYSTTAHNDTLYEFSRLNETGVLYEEINATFNEPKTGISFIDVPLAIATGVWSVLKAIPGSIAFLLGTDGLVVNVLGVLPLPGWFVGGVLTLLGIIILFIIIRSVLGR